MAAHARVGAMSRMDPAEKRLAWEALKERAGNGRIVPEKRKKFTDKERAQIYADYEGRCRACDRLVGLRFDCDHRVQLFRGGKHVRANWELLCVPCHAEKTGGEATGNAKCRRIETREVEGPPEPTLVSRSEWPPSRGFDTRLSKGLNGKVTARKSRPRKVGT